MGRKTKWFKLLFGNVCLMSTICLEDNVKSVLCNVSAHNKKDPRYKLCSNFASFEIIRFLIVSSSMALFRLFSPYLSSFLSRVCKLIDISWCFCKKSSIISLR